MEKHEKDPFDDRITCPDCLFFKQEVVTIKMPAADWDRLVRVNHPAFRWMHEMIKMKQGWASITHPRSACHGGPPYPMPRDLKHRCDSFQPLQGDHQPQPQAKEWWE